LSRPDSRWRTIFFNEKQLIQTIIAANVVMFLLSLLMSRHGLRVTGNPMTFLSPDSQGLLLLGATGRIPIDNYHRWWTLCAASYLHGGLLHIVFNMLAFRQIASLIIREYGVHRMFVIYTASGIVGFLVSYLAGVALTIGASAAVCGLIGSALYYGKARGGLYGQAVYKHVGGWALGIVLFGILIPGINNWAHGGGMVAGALSGFMLGYRERLRESGLHRWLSWGCFFGTAAVLIWAVLLAMVIWSMG
jgi:rhomboid protease GluP